MTKKLPTIGKNEILTVLVVFAAVFAKTLYEMSTLGPILPETLIRVSVASVAFSVFLLVSFSKSIGRSFTGQDFVGVFALIYTLGVTIEMRVIRFDILTFIGFSCFISSGSFRTCDISIFCVSFLSQPDV